MKGFLRYFLTFLFLCSLSFQTYASHIMGGAATYKYLGNNKYAITFIFYKDCQKSTTSLASTITYYIVPASLKLTFAQISSSANFSKYAHYVKLFGPVTNVSGANSACGSYYCTDKGYYNDTFTEGTDTMGYYIYTGNSARNAAITNLALASNFSGVITGISLNAFIPPSGTYNSSPQLLKDMTPTICINKLNIFNAGFYDPNNDSLVFSFVNPVDDWNNKSTVYPPNYPVINFKSGYSLYYPFGTSSPAIKMDSSTGVITAQPKYTGFYVVTVQIQDYRVNPLTHKGQLMATTRVDLEFVAVDCGTTAPPKWGIDSTYKRTVQVGTPVCFEVKAYDTVKTSSTGYDTITMTASGDMLDSGASTFPKPWASFTQPSIGYKIDSGQFCWTPSCAHITYTTPHSVTFQIRDQHCNTITKTWSIYVQPRAFVKAPAMRCVDIAGPNYIKLQWDTIQADTNFLQYNIYRMKQYNPSRTFDIIKTITDRKAGSWIDSSALNANDTTYFYYIVSENKCAAEGFSSDTFESLHASVKYDAYGGAEIDWNPISYTYKDSFAILEDMGSGVSQVATVNGLNYRLPFCDTTVKSIQVVGLSKFTTCQCHSNIDSNISVIDTTPPVRQPIIYASVVSRSEIDLLYTKTTSADIYHYDIYRSSNGGPPVKIDSVYSFGTGKTLLYQDRSVSADSNQYCYFIYAIDFCGNVTSYSKHCAIYAKIKLLQNALQISWTQYVGFTPDSVNVQQYVNGKWMTRKNDHASDTIYSDTGIICLKRVYRIFAYYGSDIKAYSDSVFGTPIDTIPPTSPPNTLMTFDPYSLTKIDMAWQTVGNKDVAGYKLYSWIHDSAGAIPATLTSLAYPKTDTINATDTGTIKYCYDLIAFDSCGNSSLIHKYCAINLNGAAKNLSASLIWSPEGQAGIGKYYVQQSISGKNSWTTVDSFANTDTVDLIKGLSCNVLYDFRIRASLSSGARDFSNTITVRPYDTIKPEQVNIESVSVPDTSTITITFDKVSDPVVSKYLIYQRKNTGPYSLIATITKPDSNPVTYIDTGLNTREDSFSYEVFAVDSCAGNTSITTQVDNPVLLKVDSGQYLASLKWTKYKGFTVGSYTIQYYSGGWKTLKTVASNVINYVDQPIPCIHKSYRILVNPASGSLRSISDSITVKPYDHDTPATPVLNSASVTSNHSILVSWNKSASVDVNKYYLYREKSGAATLSFYKALGNVTNFIDSVTTDSAISYCYAIQAVDSCEENKSLLSATQCAVNLTADSNICYQKLYIGWTAYTGWAAGVKNYQLYRHVEGAGTDTLIATLSDSTFNYIDSTMSNDYSYCYKIVALQRPGGAVTSSSNYDCSKIYQLLAPEVYSASKISTSTSNGTIVIKWKPVTGQRFYKYYQLFYKVSTATSYTLLQNNIPLKTDSFVQNGLNTQNLDYDYYLLVVDSCGNKTPISTVHQTMTLTITVGQLIHHLSWTPYSGFNIKAYLVQRFENGQFVLVDSLPGNKTTDVIFPAPCNYNIYYRISAIDSFGHFAWSDTVGKKALDTIPSNAPTFTNASVIDSDHVKLNFYGADSSDTYAYAIQRETNGVWGTAGKVTFTKKHAAMQYIDVVKTQHDTHCYTIITLDSCLNATPSDTFCTITLIGKALDESDEIFWTPFQGYKLTNYQIQTYNNGGWGVLSTVPTSETAQIHDSLHCYIPHYYRIFGTEESGGQNRFTYSDSIEIIPFDTITPPSPVLKYASVLPSGNVKLLWAYKIHSNSKYFEVWRSVNGGTFDSLTTLTFDSTYIDNNVNAHDSIRYFIKAVDSCKSSLVSPPSDTAFVINVHLTTGFCKYGNKIEWSQYKSFPGGISSYTILKSSNGGPFLNLVTVNNNILNYFDTVVSDYQIYKYIIVAYSASAKLGSYSDSFAIKNMPYQPADTAITIFATVLTSGTTNGSIFIEWKSDKKTDTVARGYTLYEANAADSIFHLIYKTTNLSDTSYTQTNINTITEAHLYKVSIFNGCNNDGPPGVYQLPVQLQAVTNNNLTITLKWIGYSGVPVNGYDIYRYDNKGVSHIITTLPQGDSVFTDTNIVCMHRYTYMIKSRLSNGLVSLSDSVGTIAVDTIGPKKSGLYVISVDSTLKTGGKISIRFNGNKSRSRSGFNIYRQVNNGPFALYYNLLSSKSDTVYWQDQNANTVDNSYSYYIRATDSCGNQALPLDTDRSVQLSSFAFSQYNQLIWTPYHGFKNFAYAIEKRILNSPWIKIANVDSSVLTYADSDVNCKIYYEYRLRYNDGTTQLFGYSNIAGVTAIDTIAPKIRPIRIASVLTTSTGIGKVQLLWDASPSNGVIGYYLFRSTDNYIWTMVGNMIRGQSQIDSYLNTFRQSYYYKITPFDTCGNIGNGYSAVSRTINLQVQPGDQEIKLNWNDYLGWKVKTYTIIRDGIVLATVGNTATSYSDTLTTCTKYYNYIIKATADSPVSLVSMSNIDSAKPIDNIAPGSVYVRSASIDVPAGQVVISWDSSKAFDLKNYYIYRKRASDGEMIFIDSTTKTFCYEPLSHISGPDCYIVFARDYCGNQSNGSNRACLIILQGMNQRDYDSLYWNSYIDWPDGVLNYNVYKDEDKAGWIQIGNTTANSLTYNDRNLTNDVVDYCYQVEAVENLGKHNANSFSTVVCLHQDPYVFIPDAFTPNASPGINDSFGPKGMFIKNYHMAIYNRWGQIVYSTDNGVQWDGTNGGSIVPGGVYMYEVEIDGYNNKPLRFTGNVVIVY